jgi:hypothetical protein
MAQMHAHEAGRPAKKQCLDWQPLPGWMFFRRFEEVAAEVEFANTRLRNLHSLPRSIQLHCLSMDTIVSEYKSFSELEHHHVAIQRMPAWTEQTHAADELGLNDVLAALFLGLERQAADDGFTVPHFLYILDTLKQIKPSTLLSKQSLLFCARLFRNGVGILKVA